jgi:hypothetical protein
MEEDSYYFQLLCTIGKREEYAIALQHFKELNEKGIKTKELTPKTFYCLYRADMGYILSCTSGFLIENQKTKDSHEAWQQMIQESHS